MSWFSRNADRTRELSQFAAGQGLRFEEKDSYGLHKYFADMKLFKQGSSRKGVNVIQRKEAMFQHCGIMDYWYTVSTGKSSHTFKQTVYFRVSEELMLPAFHMYPERWQHRIGKWFGMQDINFIAYPQFSKYYLLQGEQEEYIEMFFKSDALIDHFTKFKGWSVEAVGRYFVMYHSAMLVSVRDLRGFMTIGDNLYDLLSARNTELEERFKDEENL